MKEHKNLNNCLLSQASKLNVKKSNINNMNYMLPLKHNAKVHTLFETTKFLGCFYISLTFRPKNVNCEKIIATKLA